MRDEIADMGARTPHELMRCAEVSFIRDCAEMAARSSLARTESRWGLYHERLDHPQRDDTDWLHHLDLRKSPTGAMEFTARPVAPHLVPVTEFSPLGGDSRHLGEVHPLPTATAGRREAPPAAAGAEPEGAAPSTGATHGASESGRERLLELVALTVEEPELQLLEPYLKDPDAAVRLEAVRVQTETAPPGAGPALACALARSDGHVRAASSLRELAEVLPAEPELRAALISALTVADPTARGAALDLLRALQLGDAGLFAGLLAAPEVEVLLAAVRALVSLDAVDALAEAAGDTAREVRVGVARGFAALARHIDLDRTVEAGEGASVALSRLIHDPDVLVRAAALEALGALGVPDVLLATVTAALTDPAWQVRAGAATALGGAASDHGVPSPAGLLGGADADVRKAPYSACCAMRRTTAPVRRWRRRSTTRTPMSVRTRAERRDETTPWPDGSGACSLNFRSRL